MRLIKPALTILITLAGITNFGGLIYHQLSGKSLEVTAEARRSGGRSGGGSFGGSRSRSSGSSSGSRSTGSSGGGSFNNSSSPSRSGGNTLIYVPGGGYQSGSAYDSSLNVIIFLLVFAGFTTLVFWLIYQMIRAGGKALQQVPGIGNELDNEQVSIHLLQVALYAQAREVQQRLNQISLELDTENPEDLYTLFQETALALLRTPENWAYVLANVQRSNRTNAPGLFNQLSVQERTKFSHESLVNMAGRIRKMSPSLPDPSAAPAAYIVVTMLIGTAHDRPLFEQVRTHEQLTETLNKLVNMPPDFLLTYEVLWTPQDEADSLSSDEMLAEYANMIQI